MIKNNFINIQKMSKFFLKKGKKMGDLKKISRQINEQMNE